MNMQNEQLALCYVPLKNREIINLARRLARFQTERTLKSLLVKIYAQL